jgi:alpha-amylase/alpha-mannosidase (GH57 family)
MCITGDRLTGYIQNIRPDGKIDVTLQPTGRKLTTDFAETLLQWLKDHGGSCDLGDKSDAEDIKRQFQVSKKTYKRAIGDLYKRHLIVITDQGIHWPENLKQGTRLSQDTASVTKRLYLVSPSISSFITPFDALDCTICSC